MGDYGEARAFGHVLIVTASLYNGPADEARFYIPEPLPSLYAICKPSTMDLVQGFEAEGAIVPSVRKEQYLLDSIVGETAIYFPAK